MQMTDSRILTLVSLARLRWLALAALLVVSVASWFYAGFTSATLTAVGVLGVGIVGQVTLSVVGQRSSAETVAVGVLAGDGVLLTALFAVHGGSATPWASLYVFPVVLAGLTVRVAGRWTVFLVTTLGYASLFWMAPADLHAHDHDAMKTHMLGMFVAYTATAGLVVFAVGRVRTAQALAHVQLVRARALDSRNQRLTSLATLAAGAAHELANPLATIAIVVGEMTRRHDDAVDQDDLALIRDEVGRCTDVLATLSADLGVGMGIGPTAVGAADLLRSAVDKDVQIHALNTRVRVPVGLLQQVLRRLVDNARDAHAQAVSLSAEVHDGRLYVTVTDDGQGMTVDQLEQAGEPFFSTKTHGRGLGLYFAMSVVEQLGGTLTLSSLTGEGTTVRFDVPAATVVST